MSTAYLDTDGLAYFWEKVKDYVDSITGTNIETLFTGDEVGTVTLSKSAAEFSMLRIYYEGYNGYMPRTMDIVNPNGRKFSLDVIEDSGGPGMRIRFATYDISGTTISVHGSGPGYFMFTNGASPTATLGTNVIHIRRVDGINGEGAYYNGMETLY